MWQFDKRLVARSGEAMISVTETFCAANWRQKEDATGCVQRRFCRFGIIYCVERRRRKAPANGT